MSKVCVDFFLDLRTIMQLPSAKKFDSLAVLNSDNSIPCRRLFSYAGNLDSVADFFRAKRERVNVIDNEAFYSTTRVAIIRDRVAVISALRSIAIRRRWADRF